MWMGVLLGFAFFGFPMEIGTLVFTHLGVIFGLQVSMLLTGSVYFWGYAFRAISLVSFFIGYIGLCIVSPYYFHFWAIVFYSVICMVYSWLMIVLVEEMLKCDDLDAEFRSLNPEIISICLFGKSALYFLKKVFYVLVEKKEIKKGKLLSEENSENQVEINGESNLEN